MKYLILQENYSTYKDLETYLNANFIDTSLWGKGESKTLTHLQKEIESKECELKIEDGRLCRIIEVVGLIVYYKNLRLIEDHQTFKDGRTRKRKMISSCSEKMISGESPETASIRCAKEELGIDLTLDQLTDYEFSPDESESMSYPGLYTRYKKHTYIVHLNDDQFNKDGYVENQSDKSTYFTWVNKG